MTTSYILENDMESVAKYVKYAKTPLKVDVIYKDECCFCFETADNPNGLFICMNTFYGVCEKHVQDLFKKTNNGLYVNVRRIRTFVFSLLPQNTSENVEPTQKKHTKLAIGTEGGFFTDDIDTKYLYSIFVYPDCVNIIYPDEMLPSSVCSAANSIIAAPSVQAQLESHILNQQWDGEKREESKFSENLFQLESNKKILPTGWKCEKCDLRTNLWLNLSDGSILCGRRFFDGSGGNNHALEHYQETKFPLAVKLGTITPDGADVFSYPEDDMVNDSKLSEHLAHWGINMMNMQKSDKSMIELEIDINERFSDWRTILERGETLTPLYGPGYTPMFNLGSSCYMNAVLQVIFDIPDFQFAFYTNYDKICEKFSRCPVDDVEIQTAKIAYGLCSGNYSKTPPTDSDLNLYFQPNGIKPWMFKNAIGKGHPEFSTKKQQDAAEFFLYLISMIHKLALLHSADPTECFRFETEERLHFSTTNESRYTRREDYVLSLPIPLDMAENKEEYMKYQENLSKTPSEGDTVKADPVRLKVSFNDCLRSFLSEEKIDDYKTPKGTYDTVFKTIGLRTFPDYLIIVMKRYGMNPDWTPYKLDVLIDVPDTIDLEFLRSAGPKPEEKLICDEVDIPQEMFDKLRTLGFSDVACKKAIRKNKEEAKAIEWLLAHANDPDLDDTPLPAYGKIPAEMIETLVNMGFNEQQAKHGLMMSDNSMERAVDWLFAHPENAMPMKLPVKFRNGSPRYSLHAFISHIGLQVTSGHYVSHIKKDNKWVIFNDEYVALSEKPPKQLAYMYIYKRDEC